MKNIEKAQNIFSDEKDIESKAEINDKKNEVINEKKKKKHPILKGLLIFFIIVLLMFIGAVVAYYFYDKNQSQMDEEQNLKLESILKAEYKQFEYGDEISFEELKNSVINVDKIEDNIDYEIEINDEIKADEESYRFMQVGDISVKTTVKSKDENKKVLKINTDFSNIQNFFSNFKITYDAKEYIATKTNTYNVVDTQSPVIEGISDKEIYKGKEIDLKEGIKATDAVDGELEITIEGEVKNNEVGVYEIKATATDKNGNETTEEFKVTVKEEPKTQTSVAKTTASTSNTTVSSSSKSNTTASSSNTQGRKYNSALIKKYYTKCTDEQIDQAEAIANSIAQEAMASSTEHIQQVYYAAKKVSGYYYQYCDYDTTYSSPYYRSPYGVFCAGIATCSGTTRALGRVLDLMGYSWTHVNENQYQHQWNELTVDGQKAWADGMAGMAGFGEYSLF